MSVVLSRAAAPVLSSQKREELRTESRRLRRKMLFESLEDRSLLATLYWDPNGATPGIGGSGTWDETTANWTADSTGNSGHVAWNSANNDTAVFGGTAGTVNINPAAPTINVGGIEFSVTGFTLASAASKSLTFAATSNVSVASGASADLSGVISGTNGFTKTLPGELILSGTNTYAGAMIVSGGKLSVNGTTDIASPVTVNTGATLGGTGTINGLVTSAGGAIDAGSAGASAGTLLIDNALTLVNTSTFAAQLGGTAAGDGAGFYDQVTADDAVDLGGATLDVSQNGFLPAVNDEFTIINKTSAGPIVGTFNGLAEGQQFVADGTTFEISYIGGDGNDVVLTTITAAIPATPIYINEIYFNPVSASDAPNEYVELRGTPNAVIQMGYYLVGIEGDSTGPGDVQNIFDLSGLVFGSNGLLVIAQKANTYTTSPGANVYVNSGTGAGFGSGAGSSVGYSADSGATDIENSSASFLLIEAPTAPALTDDVDSDNNGTPDGAVYTGWTVLDSIGVVDSASDFGYAALNYTSSGSAVTTGTAVTTSFVAGYFGRIGDSTGSTAADWVASVTTGTAPNFSLANAAGTTPTSMANMPLNHIGAANPAAPASAGVTLTPSTGLATTEGGGTDTFTIVLNTQPTADVTIPLSSSDTTEGTVSPTSVTFTTANWNTPQTVTVTGVEDAIVDGTVAYTVVTGAATSTDPAYSGFDAADVAASNSDNDAAGVTVSPTSGLITTEAGGTATFTIVLNMQPTADVTIPLASSDPTEGNVSPTSVTFTTANWNVPQTVTVTGVDDALVDGTIAYLVVTSPATSTDLNYSGFNAADVSVSNTDNEAPGVTVTPTSGLTTTESGGTATFTIVLDMQPTASVTIPLTSGDPTEGIVSPTSVTFTTANWNVPQTVTVTGVDDAIADGNVAYTVITGPANSTDLAYNGFNAADVAVTNTDNEVAGPGTFTVSPTSGLTTTESGGVAVFTIVLNSLPTANVTIPLSSSDTTEGTVSPTSVTFTSANWNVPQFVTVTGVDDVIADGTIAYTVITGAATSTDANYSGANPADVSLNNVDNEVAAPAGVTVLPTSGLITTESGGMATFTVVLNSAPTANVTIPLSSSDTSEGNVSPTSITFTTANWSVPQTVTVTGVDDAIVDGIVAYTVVTGPATSTDPAYSGFNANDVGVSNTDNDTGPGSFTVSPTSGLTTTESGGIAVFTVVLNTQPTGNVVVPLSSSDTTEGTVSPTSLTFTSANWNVPQFVTVTGVDDAIVDGTIAYTIITGAATSTDTNYNSVNPADVALNNVDNEVAGPTGVTVTPTSGLITSEAGTTATFVIVLNSQPTANVTIPLTSNDTSEGTVSPSSVTFTTANWNVPQTVTVTGVDDAIVDGTIAYMIVTGAATSTDPAYSGFNANDVGVSNTDNDAGPGSFTVSPTSGLTTTESGGIAVFTVVLNTQPTADVVVPLSSSDITEGTVSPTSLTFTSANWNVPQFVTVTGADDAIADGTIAYTIITAAATSTDVNYSGVNPADVSLNNVDNEVAAMTGVTVTPTSGLVTTESGGTATFTIVLNSAPTASVTIPLSSSDATEGSVSPSSVTFTTANWNVPQTVTVTGLDDAIVDGTVAYTIITGAATSTDPAYSGFNANDVGVSNTDNDAGPGSFTVSPTSGLTTTESGGVAVFTIVLNTQPTSDVIVPLTSSDTTEGTVSPSSITFTAANWNVPQLVTVTGVDDALVDGTIAYTIITGAATSSDVNYSGVNPADVSLNNADNELAAPAGVTVTPTSGLVTTEAGGTATFTIVLTSAPTANVTIPLSSSDATEGSVSPSSVTFTTANWNVPQTVTVTGLDDALVDGTIAYTIITGTATSTDPAYSGFNANDVGVSNTDNDAGPGSFTVSPTSGLTTTESGGIAVFTVVLNTQPTSNVTIPLTSSDTTEGTVSPSSITFTSANWNVPQLVTVTGVDDAIVDGTIAYTIITGAATSSDVNYSGVNPADVSLNNSDNEIAAPAGATVTPTSGLITTESGGTATFTIVLNSQPTSNVTIPLSSNDTTEGTVSPSSITFTTANWNVPQTVTVTGVDDAIVDGTVAYMVVTGPATSSDLAYSGFNIADVSVSNTDNDVAGPGSFTVSPTSGLTTTESGGIAVFTIVLNTQPTANVTIPLTSSDTTEGTVAPSSVTFTSANWNVPQLVTVTGVDDAIVDGTIAYTIITGAAISTDANYSSVNPADVALSNADNEVAVPGGITVTPTAGLTTTEAGGTATFTIVLNSQPTSSVTIPLTSGDLTEGTVSPSSVTFTTVNWNVPQTVTVTGVDDAIVDGNVSYAILTGAATSTDATYNGVNAADVSVTNTDNDPTGNTPPTISDIGNQSTNEDMPTSSIPFTVNDAETAAAGLTVSATSSDTTLFPAGSITFGGSGANRTISLNPAANQSGTATITVTVADGSGGQDSDTFTVAVSPVNDAPTLNPISNPAAVPQNSGTQTINLTGISAGGGETQNLTVTATSSNPALIPNPTVTYTSPNSTGTLNYTPVPNQSGTSTITVTVTDNGGTANGGVNTTTQTFTVTVAGNPLPTTRGTAQVVDDPENPGRGVLVINGTSNLDLITVLRSGSNQTLVSVPLSGIYRTYDNSTFDRIVINAYAGSDRVIFDPFLDKPATIYGGAGDDIILSGAGDDTIYGDGGTDFIYGRSGNDFIFGEGNRDYLYGDDGDDVIVGGAEDDVIWGGNGRDVLNGGGGLDYIYGFGGDDLIIAGNLAQSNSIEGLESIQSKWTANQSFDVRISSLAAEVNETTVTDDGREDWIFGMDGRDWIVDYAMIDRLWDFNSSSDRRN